MGGNAGAGAGASGLSGLLGGGGGNFDPTTGLPIGSSSIGDPSGAFWGNPANPAVTQDVPTQAAQNIQATTNDPNTGQPTASPTGSQSGPSTPGWVQNLSNMFLGSGAQEAGLTGGRGGATPAPQAPANIGWPTAQAPGAAGAATPGPVQFGTPAGLPEGTRGQPDMDPYSPGNMVRTAALVSPQSAPVSGKTQAVSEPEAAAPAPETAAPAPDTTNYPDVAGTGRESGAGPGGAGAYNNPAFSTPQGGGLPPVLQDLFSLNFGRFIADLLGQQGMPASQNQAAAPPPSTDTGAAEGDTGTESKTGDKATADTGQKSQSPLAKAAGAVGAVGEAVKPKPSPVPSGPGLAAPAGAAGTATAAPTASAGAPPGAPAAGQPATGAAAPATAPGPTGTNLMGTGFFDPRAPQGRPETATATAPAAPGPTGPPGTPAAPATAGSPAAPPPGGSDFAAWRDFQLRNSDPETRRMYLENQARPDPAAPATPGGQPAGVPAGAAGASRPPGGGINTLAQPPGGQPMPDGSRVPTNGMPGGLRPNAPPPTAGYGALSLPEQQNFRRLKPGEKTNHYEGNLTFDPSLGLGDTKFKFGSGGGQFASLPLGTYYVHPGATGGPNGVGRAIGAWAGMSDSNNPNDNTVHDPLYKGSHGTAARDGVEIHPDVSGRRLITNGCIGIDRGQANQFGGVFKKATALGVPLKITVSAGPDGKTANAVISRAEDPTVVLGNSQSNQYDFDKRVAAKRAALPGQMVNALGGGEVAAARALTSVPPPNPNDALKRIQANQPSP